MGQGRQAALATQPLPARTSAATGSSMNSRVAAQEATSKPPCQLADSALLVLISNISAAPTPRDTAAGPQLAPMAAAVGTARDKKAICNREHTWLSGQERGGGRRLSLCFSRGQQLLSPSHRESSAAAALRPHLRQHRPCDTAGNAAPQAPNVGCRGGLLQPPCQLDGIDCGCAHTQRQCPPQDG